MKKNVLRLIAFALLCVSTLIILTGCSSEASREADRDRRYKEALANNDTEELNKISKEKTTLRLLEAFFFKWLKR